MKKNKLFLVIIILLVVFVYNCVDTNAQSSTQLWVDSPQNNDKTANKIDISGWVMSKEKDTVVKVLVDNKIESSVVRSERNDVIKSIKGFGTKLENPTPGYSTTADLSQLSLGNHTLTVEVLDSTQKNVIEKVNQNIIKKKPETMLWVDSPSENQKAANSIDVKGWVMSDNANSIIKVFVDGKEQAVTRTKRDDVIKAISGYGTSVENPTPGYNTRIDLTNLSYAKHTITIRVFDNTGKNELQKRDIHITRKKPNVAVCIDTPVVNQTISRMVNISGWVMSEDKNIEIHLLKGNQDLGVFTERVKRNDVIKAIKGYGTSAENPTPGFKRTFDLKNILDGKVTLTIDVRDKQGHSLNKTNLSLNLKKYDATINVSSPAANTTFKDKISARGTIVTDAENVSVEAYIDNSIKINNVNYNRPNYDFSYDVSDIKNGKHTLTIKVISNHEVVKTKNIDINVNKGHSSIIYLDYVNFYANKDSRNIPYGERNMIKNDDKKLKMTGWVVTNDAKVQRKQNVKLFIDGKETGVISRSERGDVNSATESGYGGYNINPTPGFSIDIKNINNGSHNFSIVAYNHLNEEIGRFDFSLLLYSHQKMGIDVSYHQGIINWNQVKNSGMEFAMIRAGYRGYETAAFAEDTQFVNNVRNAKAVGLEIGPYYFSQAKNYNEGFAEAKELDRLIKIVGDGFQYMPVLDVEWANDAHSGRADSISNYQRTEAARGFVDGCHSVGRRAMIYSFKDWFENKLDLSRINPDEVWLAHWTYDPSTRSSYKGQYKIWQYTKYGRISGINGNVDMDVRFE